MSLTRTSKRAQLALGILSVAIIATGTAALARAVLRQRAEASQSATEQPRAPFSHALPHLDGDHLKATIVEATYAPGESDPPHSHPCPVVVYVIEGSYRSQVKGQPEAIYHPGESFYEPPNGVHQISANASDKLPVKFLAYFVCDRDTELTVPVPEAKGAGGK
jgi:quercetin dioxygenase-like cupin family protein